MNPISHAQLNLVVNNNPRAHTELSNQLSGQVETLKNEPEVIVSGHHLPDGEHAFQLEVDGDVLSAGTVTVVDGAFQEQIGLDRPLDSPRSSRISVGPFSQEAPIRLRRLHGTTRFRDGTPVPNPVVMATFRSQELFAVGDENGGFELVLSGPETAVAVLHKSYSQSSLECWLWEVDLPRDLRVDPIIDRLEVYRLHAWEGERTLNVHFVPMSLGRIRHASERWGAELASHREAWPDLTRDDVRVFAGDTELPLLAFHELPDFLEWDDDGPAVSRPGYLLTVPKGDHRGKALRVTVETHSVLGDEQLAEYGEGYFLGFLG